MMTVFFCFLLFLKKKKKTNMGKTVILQINDYQASLVEELERLYVSESRTQRIVVLTACLIHNVCASRGRIYRPFSLCKTS